MNTFKKLVPNSPFTKQGSVWNAVTHKVRFFARAFVHAPVPYELPVINKPLESGVVFWQE